MNRDQISNRQLMVLMVTAALSPCTALLPTMTAQAAGAAGWLSPLAAIPALLAVYGITRRISGLGIKHLPEFLKKVLILLYLIWSFLLLTILLRLSGARLAEIYGENLSRICVAVLLLVAVWMALGKTAAFARAAEVFYFALSIFTAGVILLAVWKVEWSNFTVTGAEIVALPRSGIAAAGVLLNVYPAVLLRGSTGQRSGTTGWITVFCGVLAALLGVITGCLGSNLTEKTSSPFLILVQGLGVKGAFQRVEALVVTLWTLSDIILIALQMQVWRRLTGYLYPGAWCRLSVVPLALIALTCAWTLLGDVKVLWETCRFVLPAMGIIIGLLCPVLALCSLDMRKKRKG